MFQVYLSKQPNFPKNVDIDSSFNVISILFIVYVMLHFVRAIKFLYHGDLASIKIVFKEFSKAQKKNSLKNTNTFLNMLKIFQKAFFQKKN